MPGSSTTWAALTSDRMEKLRDGLASTVTGWDADQVRTIIADALIEAINPLVYDEAAALIEEHQRPDAPW